MEDKFNMYVLDTIAKNWKYLNRDNSLKNKNGQHSNRNKSDAITSKSESPKAIELQKQIDAIPPKIEQKKNIYLKK